MKNLVLTIAFMAILICTAQAQVQQLVDFDNTSDLTTLFNPDSTQVFTNISDQGISNTGSINVPIPSNDIWTTKAGYSVSGEGDVYTLSAYFKIKANSGYGGLGFSPNDTNEPDTYGSPVYGLGMCFHGGGGYFINNRVRTAVDWFGAAGDLVIGNWYKMILQVTALGSNSFDMNFQIWNSDANGVIGTKFTEWTLNSESNTQVGSATTLHVYFSAAGSRMEKIDNFEINLEGGSVIVEEGEPVLSTDAVTSITATTATCGGNVTDDRGATVTVRGVCWSTTTGPTTALSTKTSDGIGTGSFTSSLTGLAASTTYYVRAYATNGVGTSYGAEVSFTSFGAVLPVGAGTIGAPYQITTLENLYWITQNSSEWVSGKYFIQTADIDASSTSTWDGGAGWSPIGNTTTNFTGTYDGDGHTISGLFTNRSATDYQGFIGRNVGAGTISNLGVTNVNITGNYGTGGLVGLNYGTIYNCYSTGSVTGGMGTGGLIGTNFATATIRKSYSNASVSGTSKDCGGLVGQHRDGALISDCYSTGDVTKLSSEISFTSFGGLVGVIATSSGTPTITNSYSTGRVIYVSGGNPTDKGFLGSYSAGTLTNNFWDTETSLQATTGITPGEYATGKTTAEMKTNTTFLSAGWDDTIWNIGDGFNTGYPYLDWQNPTGTPLPVELTSFSATTIGSTIKLSWKTATEVNNYGFDVERKILKQVQNDNANYEKIGFYNGNGNSNSPKDYSFVDDKVSTGKYSYRLKQIDNDGQFEYSKSIEVDFNGVKNFELSQNYPNPFNPSTTIRFNLSEAGNVKLTLFNILGQEVRTLVNEIKQEGTHTINFNVSELNSGVYIYKIESGSFTQTRKMTLIK